MCHNDNSSDCLGSDKDTSYQGLYILAVSVAMCPAILLNIIAVIIFGRNLSKTSHQASYLMLVLACVDTLTSTQATVFHGIQACGIKPSRIYCISSGFIGSFFPLLCAFIASLMAFDRYLALCKPYFYRAQVKLFHGILILLFAFGLGLVLCSFPFLGLGHYYTTRNLSNIINSCSGEKVQCGVFKRLPQNETNVFGFVYGTVGLFLVVTVLICNHFVVAAVLKMRRVVSTSPHPESLSLIRGDVVFAKVMGVLAVVFLICWTPYMVAVILSSSGMTIPESTSGTIHLIAGFNYMVNPCVYIFMRRKYRECVSKLIRSILPKRLQNTQNGEEPEVPVSSAIPYF